MKDLGHGANVEEIAKKYNIDSQEIIDFSSNINPKVIPNLEKYVLEGLKQCRCYPDIKYGNLRKNLSDYIKVDSEYIVPGNGATEIIYLLMKSIGRRIAILNPTFSEYRRSAKLSNLEVIDICLDSSNQFEIDIEVIKENLHRFDSLFVCNPNNPNGKVKDLSELLKLMDENNKLLIVDETFMEFVENDEKYSLIDNVSKTKNLFILKAVTKFFGLPGIRLGYGVTSNKEILEQIYNYKEPWTVNSFADTISNYIFKDDNYIKESKDFYTKERKFMLGELRKIKEMYVYETDTNFILIKLRDTVAEQVKLDLLKEGKILIRDASNFIGLDNKYIRIAIKSHEENELIIKYMKLVLGD